MGEDKKNSESKLAAMKAFLKEYDNTGEGTAKKVHGYLYLKYINLYVYYMQKSINKLKPHPDKLVKPEGADIDAVDDIVQMFTRQVGAESMSLKTNTYHGKIMHVKDAKKVFELSKDVNLPDLPKTVIPYDKARKTVLKNPESLCVINCPCREARGPEGCYPRDVCIVIGEPWVSFVLEHNTSGKPRRITQEEALQIVEQQHKQGNIHTMFYKESENDRTYALCNCCPCCCTCMLSYKYAHSPVLAGAGYKCVVDEERCIGCGACEGTCGFGAISCESGVAKVNLDRCMGCGACEGKCSQDAIHFVADDPEKCEALDLKKFSPESFE